MIEHQDIRPAQVIGPLGEPLTLADLPPPKTRRWVVRRKAEVVAAVNGGLLSIDDVLDRYENHVQYLGYAAVGGASVLTPSTHGALPSA